MTVADIPARQRYAGNGVTTQFSTVFTFLANSHVRVIYTDPLGGEYFLLEGSHYTLTGANTNSPGVVQIIPGAPALGTYIAIMRDVPFTQTFNGEVLSNADAADLELSYDKIWQGMQQLKEGLSRTLQNSPGGPGSYPIIHSWSPVFAIEEHGNPIDPSIPFRCVMRVVDWTGGLEPKPPTGFYIGPTTYVLTAAEAADIRGRAGPVGPGGGDMLASNNLSDVVNKVTAGDTLSIYGPDLASASTVNLDIPLGNAITVVGTNTINNIVLSVGRRRLVRFTDALILTHSSTLRLPGHLSITTAPDDWALFIGNPDGSVSCVGYARSSGKALIQPSMADLGLGSSATHPTTDFLQTGVNLVDVPDKAVARVNLGLGTAAIQGIGTATGNVVQYESANKLPAADGSALINLPLGSVTGQPVPTSSIYATGTFMLLAVTSGDVANGSTISGAGLSLIQWRQNAATGVLAYVMVPGGGPPAGTWMNVSGNALGVTSTIFGGYFVRTA